MFAVTPFVYADKVSITDSYNVPNSTEGVLRPVNGMSMRQVEQKFGMPSEKKSAVGQPPIIRWIYPDFVVFFEHNTVIHSVIPR
jgi:hypothetical protein